jgi:hypothetical protein
MRFPLTRAPSARFSAATIRRSVAEPCARYASPTGSGPLTAAFDGRSVGCCNRLRLVPGSRQQEVIMKTLRILDSSGDRVLEFDENEATTTARREAKALFERMLASGSVAFKVNRGDGKPDEKTADFSALENETVIVPRVVGG